MRVLCLDIETAPIEAKTWGLHEQNISPNQVTSPGHVLCVAARYIGTRKTHFWAVWEPRGRARMLKGVHRLLSDCDAVTGFNQAAFDLKHLNREFVQAGLGPVPVVPQIDLLRIVKKHFKFPSNKLEFVAPALGLESKADAGGFGTWTDVLAGKPKAQAHMKRYCIQDVNVTCQLFDRLRDWLPAVKVKP